MSTAFTPRTHRVTIYQGDDQARIAEYLQEIEAATAREKNAGPLLGGEVAESLTLIEEHNAFVEEAKSRAVIVTVQAIGRKQWRSLIAEHPPAEGNEEHQAVGVNEDTFPDALVPISIVEPKFDTPADREAFLDALSDAQFGELYQTAFYLNRTVGGTPKALSAPSPSSSGTSS